GNHHQSSRGAVMGRRGVGTLVAGAVVFGAGAVAAPSAMGQEAAVPTVVAAGAAQVEPTPLHRNDDASIRKAVAVAEAKALPLAVADARAHAAALAQAAGGVLGAPLSISDVPTSPVPY